MEKVKRNGIEDEIWEKKTASQLEEEVNEFEASVVRMGGEVISVFLMEESERRTGYDGDNNPYDYTDNYNNLLIHYREGKRIARQRNRSNTQLDLLVKEERH